MMSSCFLKIHKPYVNENVDTLHVSRVGNDVGVGCLPKYSQSLHQDSGLSLVSASLAVY